VDNREPIFISIASYRDTQLLPTVLDCLAHARYPERLRVGVCWQHEEGQELPSWFCTSQFSVHAVDWRRSRGPCWARAQAMRMWDGEPWYLQLDSHHRFTPGWDVKLVDGARSTGSLKPLVSTYPAPFWPGEPLTEAVTRIDFAGFDDDGIVMTHPTIISKGGPAPTKARFLAAGFLFTAGEFVTDVPYDPELYFMGEEIALAVRAFTHGYDLFHPGEHVLWHQYGRQLEPKHWDDHVGEAEVERPWHDWDRHSRSRVQALLSGRLTGLYGLGVARPLGAYEQYAGLSFEHRHAQDSSPQALEAGAV
jgi:GT2 family glycosyltransferase